MSDDDEEEDLLLNDSKFFDEKVVDYNQLSGSFGSSGKKKPLIKNINKNNNSSMLPTLNVKIMDTATYLEYKFNEK